MSKLIKLTNDHYIIVDDSEIKEGDWVYHCNSISIFQYDLDEIADSNYKKITHSKQPLEVKITDEGIHLPDWSKVKPLSPKVVKELIGEVNEVEELAEKAWGNSLATKGHRIGFKYGYNQALEDNKEKKYTEEDIRKTVWEAIKIALNEDFSEKKYNEIIKSLQPKTEWEVEIVDGKLKLK